MRIEAILIFIFASIRDRPRFDSARSRAVQWLAGGHRQQHRGASRGLATRGQTLIPVAGNQKMARLALGLALCLGTATGFGGTTLRECPNVGGYEATNFQEDCEAVGERCELFIEGPGVCLETIFVTGTPGSSVLCPGQSSLDFCDCDPDSDCSPLAGDEFCACAEAQACCSVSYQCINQICRGASSPPVAKSRPPRHRRDASTPGSLVGFVHRPLLPRSSAPAASAARVWPPKTAVLNPGRSSPSAPDIRPRLPKSDRTAGAASGGSTPREVDRVTSASPNQ